ncbi:MAG: cytochrome P450 [Caldilineaceae bacterium]|nr:cytochrome P450 [Caldilineaceae bacterium]
MMMSPEGFKPIPQVAGYPVIGTLEPKRYDLLTLVRRQYARLGPVFRISSFNRTSVVLAGPEANRLMRTEGHRLFTSVPAWVELNRAFGGDNPVLLSMDPPDHGTIRSAMKPGYAGSALYPRMGQLLESQLRLIQAWPMDTPISVFPHMKRLVCLLLGYLATNEDPGEVLDDIIFLFEAVIKIHVLRTWPGFAKHLPNYSRSRRRVLAMTRRIWEERYVEDMLNDAGDFVALVRSAQAEFPELLTDNDARASIMGPFIAGIDTVAAGISFLLYNVLSRPWLQDAVVAEAAAAMADGLPTRQSLRQMDVTRRAAMETLRMFPPTPVQPRVAKCDFEFLGHRIEEGERLIIAQCMTHYLPEFFPDPERFDIDRFTSERREHAQTDAYAPYGLGAHTCLGASTADLLFLIVSAALFHHWRVAMDPADYNLKVAMLPLPAPDDRFRMRLTEARQTPAT